MNTFSLVQKTMTRMLLLGCLLPLALAGQSGQVAIPRIEAMPNQPAPYNLLDWKTVALEYDEMIYDTELTGQYLPLCFVEPSGVNYPLNPTFRLHTYVGTFSPFGNEAINVLPSLVGATLVGQNKQNQFGRNWVRMSQNFYNKVNGENIYLNAPSTSSGNDWWYDMMPNVYFYQLYDLYPDAGGEADLQLVSIADKMLEAIKAMGGGATPWAVPYLNYRAWSFTEMTPNTQGVPEPEAAGAFAWLLYQAWNITGNEAYLQGAEWALDFLDDWPSNPSYELQLPYGTLTAARMNGELGTDYDVEKMINWSFDRGPLRGWGTIVGNWNNFDVSGLVGEANDNGDDYAFQLNGIQQAAALVPAVRYDKRFARAIGKWVLNLANATRLFYPGFLPAFLQDGSEWSMANDPQQVIGYEALRETWNGLSPFSTGDAVGGDWAATNLSLYSTGSIGYLGAIVEPTEVSRILQLDVLKTDFFAAAAYPTYLYYNPYGQTETITLALGNEPVDVYDALTETFLAQNVSGDLSVSLLADAARMLVICPAGGEITYEENKLLINGVVVDYQQSAQAYSAAPRFRGLAAEDSPLAVSTSTTIYATVEDTDSEELNYTWSATAGTLAGNGESVVYTAPTDEGTADIQCVVVDEAGNQDTAFLALPIVPEINLAPEIITLEKSTPFALPQSSVTLNCVVTDEAPESLTFSWSAVNGTITGNGATVNWEAPAVEGIFDIEVTVTDEEEQSATATTNVLVRNFVATEGEIIAHYPFTGNTLDVSGNELHGQNNGALLTTDLLGSSNNAYYFNGGSQHIAVENMPVLNVEEAITVSGWFRMDALLEREAFIVSHGSWQNRWKVSITPQQQLRWTVNTLSGTRDVDIQEPLAIDEFYHFTATYDGVYLAVYLNGALAAYQASDGLIRTTTFPLLIGQMLPGQPEYNFKGVIDEVKIYDHALTPTEVNTLYQGGVTSTVEPQILTEEKLEVYPNPVKNVLHLHWAAASNQIGHIEVFDVLGQSIHHRITTSDTEKIAVEYWPEGHYYLIWTTPLGRSGSTVIKI
jgi:hypothetical protein